MWCCTCTACVWGPQVSWWSSWGSPSFRCLSRWKCTSSSGRSPRTEDCGTVERKRYHLCEEAFMSANNNYCKSSRNTEVITTRSVTQTGSTDALTCPWGVQTPGCPETRSQHWSCGLCWGWSLEPRTPGSRRRSRSFGHIWSSWQIQSQPGRVELISYF